MAQALLAVRRSRQQGAVGRYSLENTSGLEVAEELEQLRSENTQLRSLCGELEQALQEVTQQAPDIAAYEERMREYEAVLEEKTEMIRLLHQQLQDAQTALEEASSRQPRPHLPQQQAEPRVEETAGVNEVSHGLVVGPGASGRRGDVAVMERKVEPIPGYRLLERIGGGGFGEVWRAVAPGGLHKAIKFFSCDHFAEQELKSLERVQSVRHPSILIIERHDIIDGQLTIVMELADRNLWDRYHECRAQGLPGIPRDELLGYLRDAADALDYLNERHGAQQLEIKPQNLLLINDHVKVAAFTAWSKT